MKKLLLLTSLFLILTICLISCGSQKAKNESYEKASQQLEAYSFEVDYYNDEEITSIENDINRIGIELSGGLSKVSHYIKEEYGEITYAYIYVFELDTDAFKFVQEYPNNFDPTDFFITINENTVVFGNLEEIVNLEI